MPFKGVGPGAKRRKIAHLMFRRPAGPLNHLTKLQELAARGQVPDIKPGELWHLDVRHDPDCPMLHGLATCLCDPDLRFRKDGAA